MTDEIKKKFQALKKTLLNFEQTVEAEYYGWNPCVLGEPDAQTRSRIGLDKVFNTLSELEDAINENKE